MHNVHTKDPGHQGKRDVDECQHGNENRKFILPGTLIALVHADGAREDLEAVDQELVKIFRSFQHKSELIWERSGVPLPGHQEVVKIAFKVKWKILAQVGHVLFEGVQLLSVAVEVVVKLIELLDRFRVSYLVDTELFGCSFLAVQTSSSLLGGIRRHEDQVQ